MPTNHRNQEVSGPYANAIPERAPATQAGGSGRKPPRRPRTGTGGRGGFGSDDGRGPEGPWRPRKPFFENPDFDRHAEFFKKLEELRDFRYSKNRKNKTTPPQDDEDRPSPNDGY